MLFAKQISNLDDRKCLRKILFYVLVKFYIRKAGLVLKILILLRRIWSRFLKIKIYTPLNNIIIQIH